MKKKSLCIWGMIALTIFLGGCSCARQNVTGNVPDESSMSQDSNHSGETDRTEESQNETEDSQTGNIQEQTESQQEQSNIVKIPITDLTVCWTDSEMKKKDKYYPGFTIYTEYHKDDDSYRRAWYHEATGLTVLNEGDYLILRTADAEKKIKPKGDYVNICGDEAINGVRLAVDNFVGSGKPELMIRNYNGEHGWGDVPGSSIQYIEFYDLETLCPYEIDTGYEEALQKEYNLDMSDIKSEWDDGIHMYYLIADGNYLHIRLTFSEEEQKFVYDGTPIGIEKEKR